MLMNDSSDGIHRYLPTFNVVRKHCKKLDTGRVDLHTVRSIVDLGGIILDTCRRQTIYRLLSTTIHYKSTYIQVTVFTAPTQTPLSMHRQIS